MYYFDLKTNQWTRFRTHPDLSIPIEESLIEQFPIERKCHILIQDGSRVYMMGGYDNESICKYVWMVDLETLRWRRMNGKLKEPVYFHGSTATNVSQKKKAAG